VVGIVRSCLDWNPKEFCRLVGIVTSGSRASVVPVRISKEDIGFVRDEMLALIDDIDEGKRYVGIFKGSTKKDLALDSTTLPTSFDPGKTHTYTAPSMTSYVEILGEVTCSGIELSFSIPRPGSYVYAVINGREFQRILGIEGGLRVGVHIFSLMEVPLDQQALSYHIAILGATGTGKSRLTKCIVEEVLRCTDYSVVIFDHTGIDYTDKSRWTVDVDVIDSSRIVLDPDIIAQIIIEEVGLTGYHEEYIYGAIVEYMKKKLLSGLNQNDKKLQSFSRSTEVDLEVLLTMYRDASRKELLTWNFHEFLRVLDEYLKSMGARDYTSKKLKLLIITRLGKRFFENYLNGRNIIVEDVVENLIVKPRKLVVVDLSSEVEYVAKRGIVYQFMKVSWDKIWSSRGTSRKILAVIDEAHNYTCAHGCEPAKTIIARTVREGRKWGFGVVLATQRVIDLAPEIRGNINTIFFSKLQSSGDYNELKNWLEGVQYLEYTLPMLASREFFFTGLGNPLRKPLLIRVRDVR